MMNLKNMTDVELLKVGKFWIRKIAIIVSDVNSYVTKSEADIYTAVTEEIERRELEMPQPW